ncbi:MAG: S8 family serine peptidase [Thermoanaerobaculia bacterium]
MKTLLAGILVSATTIGAMADPGTSQRYLVATRERPEGVSARFTQRLEAEVVEFRSVRGFAATLTASEAAALALDPAVRFVESDPKRYLLDRDAWRELRATRPVASAEAGTGAQIVPYGVPLVQAPAVWRVARGGGIKVGVVDTGIDSRHPDLAINFRGGKSFVGDGFVPSVDAVGHGTHVAGTIGARDNAEGVVGVAPEAELYSLRVFDGNSDFTNASALIEVIDWSIANGLKVLNMSLGGPETSQLEREAFARAQQNGILVFASTGNSGIREISYPAGYEGAIGVGAIDATLDKASFSTFGANVMITAPGVGVLSTFPIDASLLPLITGDGVSGIAAGLLQNSPLRRVTGQFVDCGLGKTGEFPASVAGKLALIQRGEITFAEKAKNAKAAGATGVIIFNNLNGGFSGTLGEEPFSWPVSVSITLAEGIALRAAPAGTQITLDFVQGFDFLQGTSMSCPHVAGVAALVWSVRPDASAAQVREALLRSATDLGAEGWDELYGHGVVNAHGAARFLAPELFPRLRPARR